MSQDHVLLLLNGGSGEIVEKKSRFIATVKRTDTEEEAQKFIEATKKRYWDAKHNCFAYVIGRKAEICRCSDDGEPSQTAGKPILEVLLGSGVRNITAVVTRYFGGVLLGTGGLVRAYTQATQEGLRQCQTGLERRGIRYELRTDYNNVGKILYLISENGFSQEKAEYTDDVKLQILIPEECEKEFIKNVNGATSGKTEITEIEKVYFIDKQELL